MHSSCEQIPEKRQNLFSFFKQIPEKRRNLYQLFLARDPDSPRHWGECSWTQAAISTSRGSKLHSYRHREHQATCASTSVYKGWIQHYNFSLHGTSFTSSVFPRHSLMVLISEKKTSLKLVPDRKSKYLQRHSKLSSGLPISFPIFYTVKYALQKLCSILIRIKPIPTPPLLTCRRKTLAKWSTLWCLAALGTSRHARLMAATGNKPSPNSRDRTRLIALLTAASLYPAWDGCLFKLLAAGIDHTNGGVIDWQQLPRVLLLQRHAGSRWEAWLWVD